MGKQIWMRHLDEPGDSHQPGCMWGLVHALDYHHWNSKLATSDWNRGADVNEAEKLLTVDRSTTRSHGTKRRSLKARIKAFRAKESETRRGKAFKPRLQRTFSIHHLESLDVAPENPSFDEDMSTRSFSAMSESKKLKPFKLESKQNEIWSVPNRSGKGKHIVRRSSSLKESMEKYGSMFEDRFSNVAKLSASKSLKLTSESGNAPVYLRRIHSLSSIVDSRYFSQDFDALGDGVSGEGSVLTVEENVTTDNYCEKSQITISELEQNSSVYESNFSNDSKSLDIKCLPISETFDDWDYVRHLLDESGIAEDASGFTWHTQDQPLGPLLFEKSEACCPHKQDFYHQMMFDLVNEVLVELYDLSLPYYPKPLSSNCRVLPFPVGDNMVKDVCTRIGRFLNMKVHEKQSLEAIAERDLAHDLSWMNLQLESEGIALDFEDMIFDELLEEAMFS